jgi:hypothetical protein
MDERWGPLAALSGTWEGDAGVDVAFRNVPGTEAATPFREHTTFTPFGPVINGTQHLFGLDYRTTAWPGDAPDPFHSEIGYWLWDGDAALVMRCFTVPRGATVLAGGNASADAREVTVRAEAGSATFGILSNPYLDTAARCTHYECTISVDGDRLRYEETTTMDLARLGRAFAHTDRNELRRLG